MLQSKVWLAVTTFFHSNLHIKIAQSMCPFFTSNRNIWPKYVFSKCSLTKTAVPKWKWQKRWNGGENFVFGRPLFNNHIKQCWNNQWKSRMNVCCKSHSISSFRMTKLFLWLFLKILYIHNSMYNLKCRTEKFARASVMRNNFENENAMILLKRKCIAADRRLSMFLGT